jgi:hypothetical protein
MLEEWVHKVQTQAVGMAEVQVITPLVQPHTDLGVAGEPQILELVVQHLRTGLLLPVVVVVEVVVRVLSVEVPLIVTTAPQDAVHLARVVVVVHKLLVGMEVPLGQELLLAGLPVH